MNVANIRSSALPQPSAVKRKPASEFSLNGSAPPPANMPSASRATDEAAPEAGLTNDERSFFENLFPAAAADIHTYQTYTRSGIVREHNVGALVDRKG